MKRISTIAARIRFALRVLLHFDKEATNEQVASAIGKATADVQAKLETAIVELKERQTQFVASTIEHYAEAARYKRETESLRELVNLGLVRMRAKVDFFRSRN